MPMISEEQIDLIVERLINRIEKANTNLLIKMGKSINKIRKLTPTKAHELVQMLKYGTNYNDIIKQISKYTDLNIKDIDNIFHEYAKKDQLFYETFYKYRNIPFIEYANNPALINQTQALANMVKNEMYNFTRTNVLGYTINGKFKPLRETYNELLDTALLNVGQGKQTFDSALTEIMKQIGGSGLKTLEYESGRSVRLDSAVRMHLKGRLRELHNENQKIIADEIDADGYEITVHLFPAPDHAPVQGRQFSKEEFEKLNNGDMAKDYKGRTYTLDHDAKNGYRPISEMNCYHKIFSVVLGINKPEYTEKQLREMEEENNKGFEYEDKHYTMYEGTQLQRMLERRIRNEKDIQILAKESGNELLAGQSQNRIRALTNKYKKLNDVSGLKSKTQRMKVSNYKRSSESTKAYNESINKYKVGEINIKKYTNKFKTTTNEILFTPKQQKHINGYTDRTDAIKLIPDIIKNPDHIYIETKRRNTIWLTKKIDDKKSHKVVIKLNTTSLYQDKELGYKHSVITMHPIKTKTLEKYIGKRTIQIDNKK